MKEIIYERVTIKEFGLLDTILVGLNWFGPISLYLAITYLGLDLHIPIISDVTETFPRIRMDYNNIEEWYSTERAEEHTRYFAGIISLHITTALVSWIIRLLASFHIGFKIDNQLRKRAKNPNVLKKSALFFGFAIAVLCLFPSTIDSSPTTRMPEPNTAYAYFFISMYTSLAGLFLYVSPLGMIKIINFRSSQK